MSAPGSDEGRLEERSFQYAWNYFSLHAGHRMQAVNFFLIAATFLVSAYVAAMVKSYYGLAAGIALLGAFACMVFYRIERRVRGLVQAAEAALLPMETKMATHMANPDLRILELVEKAPSDAWSYGKVFRRLYTVVGLAFVAGAICAILAQVGYTPASAGAFALVVRLAAGVTLLVFGYELMVGSPPPAAASSTSLHRLQAWVTLLAACFAVLAGMCILLMLGVGRSLL